jgi:CRP-like cAMP-binding protein
MIGFEPNSLSDRLAQQGKMTRFQSGDVLWTQNNNADFVFVVSTGILKLQRKWPSGGHTILGLLNRGSIIGEEAVHSNSIRNSTCTAIVSGRGFHIPKKQISTLLQDKETALLLIRLSNERLQKTLTRMEELLDGPVEARLASTLLRLGKQLGISDGRGLFIPVRLTRGELAEFIGCRAETTTRLMTKWKRSGIVDTKREGIVIEKLDSLRTIANNGPK